MAGHAVKHALERASVEPAEVDDVIVGCGLPEGATGNNVGRTAALRAGCPASVPGQTISRFCASGLDAIAAAPSASSPMARGLSSRAASSRSAWCRTRCTCTSSPRSGCCATRPISTRRCSSPPTSSPRSTRVSRERQDEYALQSQQRTAAAQAAGRFDAEIVPLPSWKYEQDKATGEGERSATWS